MCGVCGAVSMETVPPLNEGQLTAMRDSLSHRGPDDFGNYLAPGIALGSRRLAILDLTAKGHMPMNDPSNRYSIVYNGEIYNFETLRGELEKKGVKFHSGTDTEVILNYYALEGPAMLERFNGMFAFAIWDSRDRTLFLARDRMGVKPLYYTFQGGRFYFASEEKAFFAAGLKKKFAHEHLEELIYFHYVSGENTPYSGIKRLLPGHYLVWKQGNISVSRWWNLSEKAGKGPAIKDPETWYRETFDDSVRLRRISDVPVGVFLSGGLDSGSVTASMALQDPATVSGFTMRFDEPEFDEGPLARKVADKYHVNLFELRTKPSELMESLVDAARFLDEPMAHASDIHLRKVAAFAKSKVTVLLSGEGSDETLAGYGWYRRYRFLPTLRKAAFLPLPRSWKRFLALDPMLQMMVRNISQGLPEDLMAFGFPALKRGFDFRENVLREAASLYPNEPARQVLYYDQHTYLCSLLDRNDRMTMAASVECRTPFLDYRLVEGAASLPSSVLFQGLKNKSLLRRSLGSRLPTEVLNGKKKGFDVPWVLYMRKNKDLKDRLKAVPEHPVWDSLSPDRKRLYTAVTDFINGNQAYTQLVRQLMMITIWYDTCGF